jgi:hypothetical protein
MARRHADDLVFYATLGIILGGRSATSCSTTRPILSPASDRDREAVGRRHVVPRRRHRHRRSASSISRAKNCSTGSDPRLCRLLRAVRPVLRPPRQFRERRAVGAADDVPWAVRLPHDARRSRSARRAIRASSTRPARRHPPVPHPVLDVLEDQGALRAGQAGRRCSCSATASAASSSSSSASPTSS